MSAHAPQPQRPRRTFGCDRRPCSDRQAGISVHANETIARDDEEERRGRLLLIGKGAVLAHRLARPLAAESDETEQRPARRGA